MEQSLESDDPLERMLFGNNLLQAGGWVEVVEFVPPDRDGEDGLLVVRCDYRHSYDELRRFVDEPHGSSLAALDGRGRWYVGRISENGNPAGRFPQVVRVKIRWLYLE